MKPTRSIFHILLALVRKDQAIWYRYLNRQGSAICLTLGGIMLGAHSLVVGSICLALFGLWIGQAPRVMDLLLDLRHGSSVDRTYAAVLDGACFTGAGMNRLSWFYGCFCFMMAGFAVCILPLHHGRPVWLPF